MPSRTTNRPARCRRRSAAEAHLSASLPEGREADGVREEDARHGRHGPAPVCELALAVPGQRVAVGTEAERVEAVVADCMADKPVAAECTCGPLRRGALTCSWPWRRLRWQKQGPLRSAEARCDWLRVGTLRGIHKQLQAVFSSARRALQLLQCPPRGARLHARAVCLPIGPRARHLGQLRRSKHTSKPNYQQSLGQRAPMEPSRYGGADAPGYLRFGPGSQAAQLARCSAHRTIPRNTSASSPRASTIRVMDGQRRALHREPAAAPKYCSSNVARKHTATLAHARRTTCPEQRGTHGCALAPRGAPRRARWRCTKRPWLVLCYVSGQMQLRLDGSGLVPTSSLRVPLPCAVWPAARAQRRPRPQARLRFGSATGQKSPEIGNPSQLKIGLLTGAAHSCIWRRSPAPCHSAQFVVSEAWVQHRRVLGARLPSARAAPGEF